jgi:hypothetical protein
MGDFTQKTQFDYLYDALADKYPGIRNADGKNTLFQFVGVPTRAGWKKNNLGSVYYTANTVPSSFDGFYASSGNLVDKACGKLYSAIKTKTNIDMAQYKKYSQQRDALDDHLRDIQADAESDYNLWAIRHKDAKNGVPPSIDEWYKDPRGGLTWADKEDVVQQQIGSVSRAMKLLTDAADSPAKKAMAALDTDTIDISSSDGVPRKVASIYIDGDLNDDIVRWTQRSDNQYDFEVRIRADKEIKYQWRTITETRVTRQCFTTNIETKVDTSRIITDIHYELHYTAVGLQSYNIARGDWYDGSLVRPDIQLIEEGPFSPDYFFGSNGILHLIPVNILVMYKPTIELTISTERYEEHLEEHAKDIEWIEIFGFRLHAGDNGIKPLKDDTNGTVKITFNSPDNPRPQIIGVTSLLRYNGH